jgi:hypothetical protein
VRYERKATCALKSRPTRSRSGVAPADVLASVRRHGNDVRTLIAEVSSAFEEARLVPPRMSLRAGDALDNHDKAVPCFDEELDEPTDAYLERNFWGIGYLDAASFQHYLPRLVEYTLARANAGSTVGEFLIAALRPPEREPPRLGSFSPTQERVLTRVLDFLAFADCSGHQAAAQNALEEWWAPGALYRPRNV